MNSYNYAGNKPITFKDIDGRQSPGDEKRPPDKQAGSTDVIEFRFQRKANLPVGDAPDFLSGLQGFANNLLILAPNLLVDVANSGIDAINYVGEEFQNPGSKDPLGELDAALREFGDFAADDTERFFNQSPGEIGRELLNTAIDPANYGPALEFLLTKKLPTKLNLPETNLPRIKAPELDFEFPGQSPLGKKVPNPGGKLGDDITKQTTLDVKVALKEAGFTDIASEVSFPKGDLGLKNRFADVVGTNPITKQKAVVNIGLKTKKSRIPISRERKALFDIENSPIFKEFNNPNLIFIEKGSKNISIPTSLGFKPKIGL